MTVPYTFANQTGNIPLSELDANFAALDAYANVAGTVSGNSQPNITDVGTLTYLSSSGNITADYFIGNGAGLTGIVAVSSYGNSNVAAYLPVDPTIFAINSNVARVNSNVANTNSNVAQTNSNVANIAANVATLQGQVYSNANVANYLPVYSGNVSANYFIGDGSQLTNIAGNSISNGNTNVTTELDANVTITTAGTNTWTFDTTGNLTAALNIIANGSSPAPVLQNFTFDGFNGIISSLGTRFDIGAKQSPTTGEGYDLALSAGSGLGNTGGDVNITTGFGGNSTANGNITLNSGPNTWNFDNTGNLTLPGNLSVTNEIGANVINAVGEITSFANIVASPGGYFIGDGSLLSNISAGNYGNANVEAYLPTSNTIIAINSNIANTDSNVANLVSSLANSVTSNTITITDTANLGNLTITDQTISGLNANQDIVFDPAGNGNVSVNSPFNVYSGNLTAEPIFQVELDGRVKVLVPNVSSYDGALNVVGSATGAEVSPQNFGVMIHTTGQPGTPARIYNDGEATYAAVINRRYNGTASAPTGVLAGETIGRLGSTPYLDNGGAGEWPAISTTRLDFTATEIQNTTNQGSKIQMFTVSNGNTTPTLTAEFDIDTGIKMTGNISPTTDSLYELGNATNRWANLWLGPYSLNIQDTVTLNNTELTVNNGTLFINGAQQIQVGNMAMTTDGISLVTANTGSNIQVGSSGDTGYLQLNMPGIKFASGNIQTDAGIPTSEKGAALGVVPLNGVTKIDPIYLPSGAVLFLGTWDAANNTPTLADGVGTAGDEYIVNVAGVQDLGSGNITFNVGDLVLYSTSNVWVDIPAGAPGVVSFNGNTGAVTLSQADVLNVLGNASIQNANLANSSITVNTGSGISLTGNTTVALGSTITLTNTGILNIQAGTGVNASTTLGNTTISIGQPVGTANSVQFAGIVSTTTIQASGNLTGGNVATSGIVIATGNVSGGNIVTTGNVTAGNLTVNGLSTLGANSNVKITGGATAQVLLTDGTGNLYWGNAGNIAGSSSSQIVGTWVPTLVASGGGTFTYSTQIGNYIKSGQSVSAFFTIVITGATGVTGTISVAGLPAASQATSGAAGGGALDNYSFAALPCHVTGLVPSNSTQLNFYWHDRAGSTNTMDLMTAGNLGTSATLTGRITYISAA